jgi:hypothetical protein
MNRILINKGKYVVKVASSDRTSSLIQNPVSATMVKNIPKTTAEDINRIIESEPNHEIYGSLAQRSHNYSGRQPQDLDIAVNDPLSTACMIYSAMQKRNIQSKVEPCHSRNAYNVQVMKNGEMVKAVDIHPINTHKMNFPALYGSGSKDSKPERIGRFNVQSLQDQMRRKANYVFTHKDTTRLLKDESDLVVIANLRLEEKKLMALAELKKVQIARKD